MCIARRYSEFSLLTLPVRWALDLGFKADGTEMRAAMTIDVRHIWTQQIFHPEARRRGPEAVGANPALDGNTQRRQSSISKSEVDIG